MVVKALPMTVPEAALQHDAEKKRIKKGILGGSEEHRVFEKTLYLPYLDFTYQFSAERVSFQSRRSWARKVGCTRAPRGRPGLLSRTSRAGTSIDRHRVRTRLNNPRGRLDSSRRRAAGRTQAGALRLRYPVARTFKTVRFTTQD